LEQLLGLAVLADHWLVLRDLVRVDSRDPPSGRGVLLVLIARLSLQLLLIFFGGEMGGVLVEEGLVSELHVAGL